jgi:hypothetical protein
MQIKNKFIIFPCKELTDKTQFGECKQVEVLFMPVMEALPQVSHWPLAPQSLS